MKSSGIDHRASRRWTVVIVRRFGKISSHEISGFWFKAFVFLLILILAGSAYLFYQNRELTAERQRLLANLVPPTTETEVVKNVSPERKPATTTIKKEVEKEEPAALTTTTEPEPPTTVSAAAPTSLEPTTTTEPVEETTTTAFPDTETVESDRISITEVKFVPLDQPQGIKVAFKLVNKSREGKKITGYTFVLARNDELENPLVESFPNTATFEEGRPTDHKKGVAFSIYQFKTIRGRLYTKEPVKEIVILVYDQDGLLIFNKSYPVPNV